MMLARLYELVMHPSACARCDGSGEVAQPHNRVENRNCRRACPECHGWGMVAGPNDSEQIDHDVARWESEGGR